MIRLKLPYPPTVNTYWRVFRGRPIISRRGREYRAEVCATIGRMEPMEGSLRVTIEMHPPDRRRRDVDNVLKAALDAMAHGGVYEDDSQIAELHIGRHPVIKGGRLMVLVEEMPG